MSVKQVFVTADDDFISWRKAVKNWLESTLTFTESAKFKPLNLTVTNLHNLVIHPKRQGGRLPKRRNPSNLLLTAGQWTFLLLRSTQRPHQHPQVTNSPCKRVSPPRLQRAYRTSSCYCGWRSRIEGTVMSCNRSI